MVWSFVLRGLMSHKLFSFCFLSLAVFSFGKTSFKMADWSDIKAYYAFDVSSNLGLDSSQHKNPLEISGSLTWTKGFSDTDGAVITPAKQSDFYLKVNPQLKANGGGSKVNQYTILMDLKVSAIGVYNSLLQTNTNPKGDDADLFIDPSGRVGLGATTYSSRTLVPEEWIRLVYVCDNDPNTGAWKLFFDGSMEVSQKGQGIDGRFALPVNNAFYFFADDNAEHTGVVLSSIVIWDRALSNKEVEDLGGFNTEPKLKPFLQSPTSSSMYISYLSDHGTGKVNYGKNPEALSFSKTTSFEKVKTKGLHSVKLENLDPASTYYYQVVSGTDSSKVLAFSTAPESSGKLVIAMNSDIHIGADRNAGEVLKAMIHTFQDLYGEEWYQKVHCIINNGDVFQNASMDELLLFYGSFISPLAAHVPFMTSMGNHDLYTSPPDLYYQFLKYDEFSAYPLDPQLNKKYYSFRLANSLFITLNSETNTDEKQTDWLEAKLIEAEAESTIDFVFINAHHPGKSEMWQDANNKWMQNTVYPLLARYPKVVMASHGHTHAYERGVIQSEHGTDFRTLILGPAGGWLDYWTENSDATDWAQTHRSIEGSHFAILEVDIESKTYEVKVYSLGVSDRKNTEPFLQDYFYGKKTQAAPETPEALSPKILGALKPTLIASEYQGPDELMSSEFQLTEKPGDYSAPIVSILRDYENIFSSTGAPSYTPIDLNKGINLRALSIEDPLIESKTYAWRVRYRDKNLKWSAWSSETVFEASSNTEDPGIPPVKLHSPNFKEYHWRIENSKLLLYFKSHSKPIQVQIHDLRGQLQYRAILNTKEQGSTEINLQNLRAGLYLISIDRSVHRLVKH